MPRRQYKARTVLSIKDRLMRHVQIDPISGCWLWTASVDDGGYARFRKRGRPFGMDSAHRVSYEEHKGPIPDGLDLDHTCHKPSECPGGVCCHRRCINPDHLEPVTALVNTRRGHMGRGARVAGDRKKARTHCRHGHEFTPENTGRYKDATHNFRFCRTCATVADNKRRGKVHAPAPC